MVESEPGRLERYITQISPEPFCLRVELKLPCSTIHSHVYRWWKCKSCLKTSGAAGWREVLYAPGLLPIYSRFHDQIFLRPSVHKFYEFNSSFLKGCHHLVPRF